MAEIIHEIIQHAVTYVIFCFEILGLLVITFSGIRGAVELVRKNPDVDLHLSEGMAVALQFMLCAEIVRLMTIGELKDIVMILGIVALHIAITVLVAWELKHKRHERHERHNKSGEN